jgi:hypothetical protein
MPPLPDGADSGLSQILVCTGHGDDIGYCRWVGRRIICGSRPLALGRWAAAEVAALEATVSEK